MIIKKYCFLTVLIAITATTTPHTPTTKPEDAFRDFEHNAPEHVKQFYRENHTNQTLAFILEKKADYSRLDKAQMSIWDAFKALDTLVDQSDVDIALPQVYHAFQTAEAIRQDGHPDWLILTGLIHDLGKVLTLFDEPQWAIVGDTFPAGCAYASNARMII